MIALYNLKNYIGIFFIEIYQEDNNNQIKNKFKNLINCFQSF